MVRACRWSVIALVIVWLASGGQHVDAQKYTFDQVVSGLKYPDAATRLRALELLKEADYPEAAVPIAEVFADPDDRVQLAAISAERSLFTTRPVTGRRKVGLVIEVRSTTQTGESQLALKARSVPPQILGGLTTALRDGNPNVRAAAIDLAALLAPQTCRSSAGRALKIAPELCDRLGNALIENINARQVQPRRAAMRALGRLRYGNAVQALSDQLSYYQQGPDAIAALDGLAGIGHSTSISLFQQALTSSNPEMRRLAIEGTTRGGDKEALAELHRATQGERSSSVLLALHYANAMLGATSDSTSQLIAALQDNSLRPLAARYLLDISETMAPLLVDALHNANPDARHIVIDILGFSGDPRVLSPLEAAMKDPDPDVALAAERAIARLKLQ